jgi:asparagine synthase (glutamine-hydrolysing)
MKYRQGNKKALLKDIASAYLPESLLTRKKMGFSFPFKEWIRGEKGERIRQTFAESRLFRDGWIQQHFAQNLLESHRAGRRDESARIWLLYDLCRWYDRWIA